MEKKSNVIVVGCDTKGFARALRVVETGGLIVYPTDTVYGLGCQPFNKDALRRLCLLKGRGRKPLPLLCSDVKKVSELVDLGATGLRLAHAFWPGALTIVAPITKNAAVPSELTFGTTLGVRIPRHEATLESIRLCGGMLVGTSANLSGLPPPRSPDEVFKVLPSGFDVLLDCGATPLGVESTVILLLEKGWRVLRKGAISSMEVKEALAE